MSNAIQDHDKYYKKFKQSGKQIDIILEIQNAHFFAGFSQT